HPRAAPLPAQESRLREHLQVMADGGLGEAERLYEMADACLRTGLRGDVAEETQAPRIGDRLEGARQLLRIVLAETAAEDRRTAPPLELHRHELILTYVDAACKDIDSRRWRVSDMAPEATSTDELQPIQGPAAWRGRDLAGSHTWTYRLSAAEADDVERMVA